VDFLVFTFQELAMAIQLSLSTEMQECIDACNDCHAICLNMATTFCLNAGGQHAEEDHIRLMLNCAEICRTTADIMITNSPLHGAACAACAEFCEACAERCEQVGNMDECVQACRQCAENCEDMAKSYVPPMRMTPAAGVKPVTTM
jgi:hypothetical protein